MPNDLRERVRHVTTIHGMPPTPSAADRADEPLEEPPADPAVDPADEPADPAVDPVDDPVAGTPNGPGPGRRALALVVLILPLVLAALWAAVGPTPAGDADRAGAGGPLQSALADASAQSTFTRAGAEQLRDGSAELADGAEQMRAGGAELADGMDQLQSAIGQAGSGATEVAGGVREVVGAVRGVAVIQGQVSTAIDDALGRLQGDAPEVIRAREALTGLQQQLATQGMGQGTLDGLDALEGGADELARQLSAPGAPLRDGVFQVTRGSHELRDGAAELAAGTGELRDGAASVAGSAERTDDAIGRAGRALAAERGDAGAAAAEAADDTQRRTSAGILALAAAAVLGALLVNLVRRPGSGVSEPVLALAVLSAGLSAWALATADAPTAATAAAVVGLILLVVVASSALWHALTVVLGTWPGRAAGLLVAAASIGVAWWVWVSGGAPTAALTAVSGTPTGQATAALDAVLLGGPPTVAWTAAAVLVAVALCAAVAAGICGQRPVSRARRLPTWSRGSRSREGRPLRRR
ncbi:putative membrane protein [Dietzia sp. 2505]